MTNLSRDDVAYMAHTVTFYDKVRRLLAHAVISNDNTAPHVAHTQGLSWGGGVASVAVSPGGSVQTTAKWAAK
jgi:hypothetical protein